MKNHETLLSHRRNYSKRKINTNQSRDAETKKEEQSSES